MPKTILGIGTGWLTQRRSEGVWDQSWRGYFGFFQAGASIRFRQSFSSRISPLDTLLKWARLKVPIMELMPMARLGVLGMAYLADGRSDLAKQSLQRALADDPHSPIPRAPNRLLRRLPTSRRLPRNINPALLPGPVEHRWSNKTEREWHGPKTAC